ncbi:membrane protein [Bacillus coahuilensis p1.1.43]|uniref:Membrane protein n=1 Tax=Bacillus coahuilensis p1.1.43 TaxID=1150625 RepID=A0A147KAN0_9BACI|nr:hypothetical protein [Bacillus coahuilensis]KUP07849.1 membrane protein [Bacillus coahuilensis p1.1.43]
MQIFSTFEQSINIELAICTLEKNGIQKHQIFAIPMNNRKASPHHFDTIHSSDGVSLIDIGMALATAFSVITASIGFDLKWGPIVWGIIGAVSGFILGFLIRLVSLKAVKKRTNWNKGTQTDVILIIECTNEQMSFVETILWEHKALGLAKVHE